MSQFFKVTGTPIVSLTVRTALENPHKVGTSRIERLVAKVPKNPDTQEDDIFTTGDIVAEQWGAIQRARAPEKPDYLTLLKAYENSTFHPDMNSEHPAAPRILSAAANTFLNFSGVSLDDEARIKDAALILLFAKESPAQNLKTLETALKSSSAVSRGIAIKALGEREFPESSTLIASYIRSITHSNYGKLNRDECTLLSMAFDYLIKITNKNGDTALYEECKLKATQLLQAQFAFDCVENRDVSFDIATMIKNQFGENLVRETVLAALKQNGFFTDKPNALLYERSNHSYRSNQYVLLYQFIDRFFTDAHGADFMVKLIESSAEKTAKQYFIGQYLAPFKQEDYRAEHFELRRDDLKKIITTALASPETVAQLDLLEENNFVAYTILNLFPFFTDEERAGFAAQGKEAVATAFNNLGDLSKRLIIIKTKGSRNNSQNQIKLLEFFGVIPE